MKKHLFIFIMGLMILGLLTPQSVPKAYTYPTSLAKQVAAYFFYWYSNPDHPETMTDHPPDSYLIPPPSYSFNDVGWHRRELLDQMSAGIDIILPVYWGDYTNIYWSQPGLTKLVQAENQLISEGNTPPKIGMFYNTDALPIQNGGQPPDLTTIAGKQLFYKMIDDFFDLIPNHNMWARMNGKPIIFLYASSYASNYNQSTFDFVISEFGKNFPGEIPYIAREASWKGVTTDSVYGWSAAVNGPFIFGDLATVGPGYNESAIPGRNPPLIRDRECGEFYKNGWDQIKESSATLTVVETWNEYAEGSDVAASKEYDRKYIDLTSQNIQAWKAVNITNKPYVWIDLGKYTYSPGLHALNSGDGIWNTLFLAGRQAAYPVLSGTVNPSYNIYLNVDDTFIFGQNNVATPTWVTVEYYDGGTDGWYLEYDSAGPADNAHVYKSTNTIKLQNSNEWKSVTFYLPDAYLANRQQGGLADLRLVNGYDGKTNYFGRVWVSKTDPSALHAPNLTGLTDLEITPGVPMDILITPNDPGGGTLTLSLDRAPEFASLIDHHNGSYTLHLEPSVADASSCSYRLRLIVADATNPPMMDAETISIRFAMNDSFLPIVKR